MWAKAPSIPLYAIFNQNLRLQKKSGSTEKIEPLFVSAVFSTFYAFRTTHPLPKKKKAKNEKKANVKNVIPKIIRLILSNSILKIKCFYK